MFNQFRSVVENFNQQSQQQSPSQRHSGSSDSISSTRRSGSLDDATAGRSLITLSTEQLASSLKKSFAAQRQISPAPLLPADGAKASSSKVPASKLNLEERLKASIASDTFSIETHRPITRPSSPQNGMVMADKMNGSNLIISPKSNSRENIKNMELLPPDNSLHTKEPESDVYYLEADIPLPPSPAFESQEINNDFLHDVAVPYTTVPNAVNAEGLQLRLKEVEDSLSST